MEWHLRSIFQDPDEIPVLFLGKRAVEIISLTRIITRSLKNQAHIQGVGINDGGDGIVESQVLLSDQASQVFGQSSSGQRPGGDNQWPGSGWGDGVDLLADDGDQCLPLQSFRDPAREKFTIHRQGPAGRDSGGGGGGHNQGVKTPHFLLEQAHGVVGIFSPQGVTAYQLSQVRRFVRRAERRRLHLVQRDLATPTNGLPGSLHPGQTPADNGDFG